MRTGTVRCELLSNCILSIFDTVFWILGAHTNPLWIAFKLYFIDLWHSKINSWKAATWVVNCFQIVFYRSLTQCLDKACNDILGCELLSNCILSIFDTVRPVNSIVIYVLWIAFKLYFIDLWHSQLQANLCPFVVVNCFQIVFYRSLTQLQELTTLLKKGCELLSNCILSIFDTVINQS